MNLGERIKEIRKDNLLTQDEFAKRMLVSASYISKVESGKEKPSDIFLKLMSLEFNINLEWLIKGKGTKDILNDQHDYFERNQDYTTDLEKDIVDFEKVISLLPDDINASICFMLKEYSHLLKSEYLTESQKTLIASIIADIFTLITEMIDKFFTINRNDEKDILRFELSFQELHKDILDKVNEIKDVLIPNKIK